MFFSELNDLPLVLHEDNLKQFKFWFNGALQDGLTFKNELFCRLHSVKAESRALLYQYAFQLASRETIVITASKSTYSIWISLRSSRAAFYITKQISLPPQIDAAAPTIFESIGERTAMDTPSWAAKVPWSEI